MYDFIFYERRLCRHSGLPIRYIDQATSWNAENIWLYSSSKVPVRLWGSEPVILFRWEDE